MRRREFITLVGCAAIVWSFAAQGQSPKPVIGFLRNTTPDESAYLLTALRKGLNEAGYVEGEKLAIEYRWGGGHQDHLRGLADDHDNKGQITQSFQIGLLQSVWSRVEQTQRADTTSIIERQRIPRVKSDSWTTKHQRIISKALIAQRIHHNHRFTVRNHVGTERCVTRILSTGGTLARFEPLSSFVDEGDGRHWHIE